MAQDGYLFDESSVRRIGAVVRRVESQHGGMPQPRMPAVAAQQVSWFAAVQTPYAGLSTNPVSARYTAHGTVDTIYGIRVPLNGEQMESPEVDTSGILGGAGSTVNRDTDGTPQSVVISGQTHPAWLIDLSQCVGRPFQGDIVAATNVGGRWYALGSYRTMIRCVFKEFGWAWIGGYSGNNTQGTFQSPEDQGYNSDASANLVFPWVDPFGIDSASNLTEGDEICIEWGQVGTDPTNPQNDGYMLTFGYCEEV